MNEENYLYVLVRIRKSGSQSLARMISSAFPESGLYSMPPVPPLADRGIGFMEDFRRIRRTNKRLWRLFRTWNFPKAWDRLNAKAKTGDIVAGHFSYGVPQLPDWNLRYITLVRDPMSRLLSEYRYCRQSYLDRPAWRRAYLAQRLKVAGTGEFGDYVDYLHSKCDRFANPTVAYITGGRDVDCPYTFLTEHYFHYGTLEHLDAFASGLSTKLGREIEQIWRNKTGPSKPVEPEDHDPAKLQDLLGKDLELYRRMTE